MTQPLPPLNALRAFEAAARSLSFKKAADELHVTPAAISQQIKTLEDFLGIKLFHRMTRAIRLTEAGEAALPSLTLGFDHLAVGVSRLRKERDSGLLTISASPGFASMWLVPRLDCFFRQHPEIEVRIDGTDRVVDVTKGDADVAIRYGPGGYIGVTVDFLFNQRNTPVCSPTLVRDPETPLRNPEDLQHHTLLHVDWSSADASWRMWLAAAGVTGVDPARGPHFMQEDMAVQAALDGQGVALIGDRLVAEHLAAGRLINPFEASPQTPLSFSYYLLSPKRNPTAKVAAFRDWMRAEVRSDRVLQAPTDPTT